MSQNRVAVLETGRSRFPTADQPVFKKFIRGRMFIPDDNCRHGSQSGSVVNEEDIFVRYDDVVREFVLRHHLGNDMRMEQVLGFR